jgi:tetratricopeptide (TPR) repeat protein
MQLYHYIVVSMLIALHSRIIYSSDFGRGFDPHRVIEQAVDNMEQFPVESKYNMALAYDALGDLRQAAVWYQKTFEDPNATRVIKGVSLNNMAVLLQENGYFDKALSFYMEAIKYGDAYTFYNMGLIYWDAADIARAGKCFEQAQRRTSDPRFLINMGVCYYRCGLHDKALKSWHRAWQTYRDYRAAFNIADAAANSGALKKATHWMKKAARHGCLQAQQFFSPHCSARSKAALR